MAKRKLTAKQKAIKEVGKKAYNNIKKKAKEIRKTKTDTPQEIFKEFKEIAKSYKDRKGTDQTPYEKAYRKLMQDEVKNFVRSQERKVKKLHEQYNKKMQQLGGAKLKDASQDFKNELLHIQKEQTVLNTLLRPIKKELEIHSKFELKYNPETDEVSNYKAWEQKAFEKELFSRKEIYNVNGLDVKTQQSEILDLINDLFSKMDSTKLFAIRFKSDGEIKLFIADENDIDENENEE